jgi:RNA polymerase sigma factor (sigma-70 family)
MSNAVHKSFQTAWHQRGIKIDSDDTEMALQHCLDRLAGATDDATAREIVREVLSVAAERIQFLCGLTLGRHYPRLTKGPFNVQSDEVFSSVAERLIKAMRNVRPTHVRGFFALTMKHVRWELNGLARDLNAKRHERLAVDVIAQESDESDEPLSPLAHRIMGAINTLPQIDRDIFEFVRVSGMTQSDAAQALRISEKTVNRRLSRILPHLWAQFGCSSASSRRVAKEQTATRALRRSGINGQRAVPKERGVIGSHFHLRIQARDTPPPGGQRIGAP